MNCELLHHLRLATNATSEISDEIGDGSLGYWRRLLPWTNDRRNETHPRDTAGEPVMYRKTKFTKCAIERPRFTLPLSRLNNELTLRKLLNDGRGCGECSQGGITSTPTAQWSSISHVVPRVITALVLLFVIFLKPRGHETNDGRGRGNHQRPDWPRPPRLVENIGNDECEHQVDESSDPHSRAP